MKTKERIVYLEREIELLKQKKQLLEDIKNLETADNLNWGVNAEFIKNTAAPLTTQNVYLDHKPIKGKFVPEWGGRSYGPATEGGTRKATSSEDAISQGRYGEDQ